MPPDATIAVPRRDRDWLQRRTTRLPGTRGLDALIVTAVVLVVAAPMLFTNSGFAIDFTNHLWLTWVAGRELAWAGRPDYFINLAHSGVFYPFFAFYGGTLFNLTGVISDLLGDHPEIAFVGVTTLAV